MPPTTFVRLLTYVIAASIAGSAACRSANQSSPTTHPTAVIQAASRQAQSVDPTGHYDLSFTDDGDVRSATMVVDGTPGAYRGNIKAENRPDVAITAAAASGPQVIVTGDIPQGVLLLRFRVTGDSVRGDWSLRNDGGRLAGVRRPLEAK